MSEFEPDAGDPTPTGGPGSLDLAVNALKGEPNEPISDENEPKVTKRKTKTAPRVKKYKCDYEGCTKAYSRPCLLTQHQRSHTETRPFVCDICNKGFFRLYHLQTHQLSHTSVKPFHCSVCDKGFNSKQHLNRHEITHTKSFKCTYDNCTEAFYKHQSLNHHIRVAHLESLRCDICRNEFSTPAKLAAHKTEVHGDSPAYQCDKFKCYENFPNWAALQRHIREKHPTIQCPACDKVCLNMKSLKLHWVVHKDMEFPQNVTATTGNGSPQNEIPIEPAIQNAAIDELTSVGLWKCNVCPADFIKKDDLSSHVLEYHSSSTSTRLQPRIRNRNTYTYEINDAGHEINDNDDNNDNNNETIYENNEPNEGPDEQQFTEPPILKPSSTLDLLVNSVGEVRLFRCTFKDCDRTFRSKQGLTRHKNWHIKEEPWRKNLELDVNDTSSNPDGILDNDLSNHHLSTVEKLLLSSDINGFNSDLLPDKKDFEMIDLEVLKSSLKKPKRKVGQGEEENEESKETGGDEDLIDTALIEQQRAAERGADALQDDLELEEQRAAERGADALQDDLELEEQRAADAGAIEDLQDDLELIEELEEEDTKRRFEIPRILIRPGADSGPGSGPADTPAAAQEPPKKKRLIKFHTTHEFITNGNSFDKQVAGEKIIQPWI